MQPALSSSHISSSMNFWYSSGMRYGLWAMWGLVVGISISNNLVLPTSADNFDTLELNLVKNSNESLCQAFWRSWASSSITDYLLWLLGSGWKLDCGSTVGSKHWCISLRFSMVFLFKFLIFAQDVSLISTLSILTVLVFPRWFLLGCRLCCMSYWVWEC